MHKAEDVGLVWHTIVEQVDDVGLAWHSVADLVADIGLVALCSNSGRGYWSSSSLQWIRLRVLVW